MTKEQNKVTYSVTWDEFEKTMYHTNTRIILAIEEYDNLMKETFYCCCEFLERKVR